MDKARRADHSKEKVIFSTIKNEGDTHTPPELDQDGNHFDFSHFNEGLAISPVKFPNLATVVNDYDSDGNIN